MKENQIFSLISFIAVATLMVVLIACSPSDSAPYYLNKSSESLDSSSTSPASTETPAPAAPAPAAPAPVAPKASCTTGEGGTYADGVTILAVCRMEPGVANLVCYSTVRSVTYYKCNDGKWVPQ